MKKIPRKKLIEGIGKVQDLVGRAMGAYLDDRSADRNEKVTTALEEAFDVCVDLRSTDGEKR